MDPAKAWGAQASTYATHISPTTGRGAQALVDLVEKERAFDAQSTVLDEGAGTGILTEIVLRKAPGIHITAADVAPGMLEVLEKKKLPNVEVIVVDALKDHLEQGLKAEHYTHALSAFMVQFINPAQRAFDEMFRLLQSGGVAGVSSWEEAQIGEPWNIACKNLDPDYEPFRPFNTPIRTGESLERALEAAGFKDVKSSTHDCWLKVNSAEQYCDVFMDSGNPPFLMMQSTWKGDKTTVREEMIRVIREQFSDCRFYMKAACGVGRKP